jgi:membrane associated rhomboid family serine protease
LVWIAQLVFEKQYQLTDKLALYPIDTPYFKPYQIATHMFAHAAYSGRSIVFYHILFNMFALWMFGKILENVWGAKRFLIFYLICGVGAAAVHLGVQHFTGGMSAAVGASGAIMGIFAAFAYLFPNTELFILFIPFPIKAKWAVLGLAAIDLFGGLTNLSGDNIAHFAHLGGALTGFILVLIWNKTNRKQFY